MILHDIFLNHKIKYIFFNLFNLKYNKEEQEKEKKINEINSINFILHNKKNNFIINNFINESLKFNKNLFNDFIKKDKIIIHINFSIFDYNINIFLSHLFIYLKDKNINFKKVIILFDESTESRDKKTLNDLNDLILKKQSIYNFKYFIITCNAKFKNDSEIIFFPSFNYYFLNKKIGSKKSTSDIFNIFLKYKKNNKTFLFCSLNRVIRNHRIAFLYYLKNMSFNNHYLISFDEIKKNQYFNNLYEEYLIDANKLFEIKTPIILDITNFKINQADHIGPFYINSFFSQVNETLVDNQNIFLSEKTFKPIIRLSPFIIFGNPNTLKELSAWDFEINFKGINNSYDNEENNLTRLQMILNEIKKLDLPKKDLLDFYYQNRETLIYNYDRYFNLNQKDIIEKTNFKKIIELYES